MIRVYADWQPGYMGEKAPTKTFNFKTLGDAQPTIDKWKNTARPVVVSEFEEKIIAKYVWGKKQKVVVNDG